MKQNSSAVWRPFTQMMTASPPLEVNSAQGCHLELSNGKILIDAISSWWVITHGHCHPEIMKAIAEQSQKLDQVLFANFTHKSAEDLAQKITSFLPQPLSKVFFSDNGSTAVEVALKMAIQACRQKGQSQKNKFVALQHSYHGDTVGAMSVAGRSLFTKPYEDMLFQVLHAPHPTHSFESVDHFSKPTIELIEKHHSELAGIIIEPLIQGAGGMITWPKEALDQICQAAKKHDLFLIFDEVMTGFGRTGSLFAFEQLNAQPDFICLSKGLTGGALPLSLTITTDEVFESFLAKEKDRMFFHGHSFTGNPISCAAALANLNIIEKNKTQIESQWVAINQIHKKRIAHLPDHLLLDRRVLGTMAAVEIKMTQSGYGSNISEKMTTFALQKGVFLRPLGNVIYILPPYCITDDELNKVWDTIEEFLRTLAL